MANLVISAAGAAVGYLIGGPTGAQIGWMVGSYLSASNSSTTAAGVTVGDLRVQTSQYGVNIPVPCGKQRISGNVIWATDKTTYEMKSGSSGGKGGGSSTETVTIGYKVNLAIAICKGPILGISRVWANGTLIVDARTTANPLVGTLYLGSNSQSPDPTMESHLGAGNVPAYRGLAYIVLTDFDLGTSGVIPQLSFEILKQGGI